MRTDIPIHRAIWLALPSALRWALVRLGRCADTLTLGDMRRWNLRLRWRP